MGDDTDTARLAKHSNGEFQSKLLALRLRCADCAYFRI